MMAQSISLLHEEDKQYQLVWMRSEKLSGDDSPRPLPGNSVQLDPRDSGEHLLQKNFSIDLETIVKLSCHSEDTELPAVTIFQPKSTATISLWNGALGPRTVLLSVYFRGPQITS